MMKRKLYSWILPVRNEAGSLAQLLKEISQVMHKQSYEVIAIDDDSDDGSGEILNKAASRMKCLKIMTFSEQRGKWEALSKGIKEAKGDLIISLDSDLQDNPAEVTKLIKELGRGYDVVSGWRKKRFDPLYKVVISRLGNSLVTFLGLGSFHDLNSPFKIYRKKALQALPKEGTLFRFSLLFAANMGLRVAEVPVNHRPRRYGVSKFGLVKYSRIIYDLVLVMLLFSGSGRLMRRFDIENK